MIGAIDDPRILARIGSACGLAAGSVRQRLTRAAHKEAEGQSGTREEVGTEELSNAIDDIDALGDAVEEEEEGGGDPDELIRMMQPPYRLFPREFEPPAGPALYFDPGVTVLPAARVLAMSEGAKAERRVFPIGASDVLKASIPFGEFITGLFAPCLVGDMRLPLLQLATPPRRRKELAGGLDAPVPALGALEPKRFFEFRFAKKAMFATLGVREGGASDDRQRRHGSHRSAVPNRDS